LFAVWTTYGLLSAWQSHYWYSFSKNPMSWADCIRYEMTYAWICGACSPAILWLSNRFRIERDHRARHLLVHVAVMTVFVALTKTLYELIGTPHESVSCTSPGRSFSGPSWFPRIRACSFTG
jgi:hypothetical protein